MLGRALGVGGEDRRLPGERRALPDGRAGPLGPDRVSEKCLRSGAVDQAERDHYLLKVAAFRLPKGREPWVGLWLRILRSPRALSPRGCQ